MSWVPFRCPRVLKEKAVLSGLHTQGLLKDATMTDMVQGSATTVPIFGPRFEGRFRWEKDTKYGFLMEPKGVNGQPPDGLPDVDGELGGVFLSRKVAEKSFGKGEDLLKTMDGERFSFAIRRVPDGKHANKMEAWNVRSLDNQAI